ncbi:MAG: hypothetical protein WBV82_16470 [Myxococcaceae bacterium]
MSGVALLFAMATTVTAAAPPCFHPDDQTAGWKVVSLPDEAPGLAAPPDLHQFRGGEPSLLWDSDARAYLGALRPGAGRRSFEFSLPSGTRRAEIEFAEDLRGAKVDAALNVGGRLLPLADERRISGRIVQLDWSYPDGATLQVVVHHHLRRDPIPTGWRFGRSIDLASATDTPAQFRRTRVLYFLHPGGRRIELCHAPGQKLWTDRRVLEGEVTQVGLIRQR